jgi:hypothetical protein
VEGFVGLRNTWRGDIVEKNLRLWYENMGVKKFRDLHLILSWGIWLTKKCLTL